MAWTNSFVSVARKSLLSARFYERSGIHYRVSFLIEVSENFFILRAVGRTFQAVESHLSSDIFEIEQKQRPVKCALCSVSSGIHAMYPLFDYHGKGGRQICITTKTNDKNGNGKERVLVWAHALCALYLASVGFMYACFKDGEYIGMDEEEKDNSDSRPPNPEVENTKKFQRMYGDAMPHFRYYMTPPSGKLDVWTKSIRENQRELKCIECGLKDDGKSMRIPLQCVANDQTEYAEHRKKHRERNNDIAPCTQALHVGCARWADESTSLRKCYYFPGSTKSDGSVDYVDTVHCLYCKTHAENVDDNYQKLMKQNNSLFEKKKLTERNQLDRKHQQRIRTINLAPKATSTICRPVPRMKSMNPGSKGTDREPRDKRSRQISSDMPIATKDNVNQIFNDLVSHRDEIARNPTSTINGRKKRWKNKMSGLSTADFDNVWTKARKRFYEYQNRESSLDDNKSGAPTGVVSEPCSDSMKLPSHSLDTEETKAKARKQKSVRRSKNKNIGNSDDDSAIEMDFNASKQNEPGGRNSNADNQKSIKKPKMTGERSPDRWSKLFIGEAFEMGHEFTFNEFEQKTLSKRKANRM